MSNQLEYHELKRIGDVLNCPGDVVMLLVQTGALQQALTNRKRNTTRRRDDLDRKLATIARIEDERKAAKG